MRDRTTALALLAGGGLLVVTIGLLAVVEFSLSLLIDHPPGPAWEAAARQYYYWWERRIVQFLPQCARYDAELTYTLRPGTCRFENREFSVDIKVNSLGFRSTDRALDAPRVIVAGDSYAMGWGVVQDSTFGELLAQRLGVPVLNTGVSSYGTARELLALRRVDLSAARYLVIQYSSNDFHENTEYLKGEGHLKVQGRAAYDSLVREHDRTARYFPGKYILRFLPGLRDEWLRHSVVITPRDGKREAAAFLDALRLSPVSLDSLAIIVFELNPLRSPPSTFAAELRGAVAQDRKLVPGRQLVVLDPERLLIPADYFALDDHIRAEGHVKIAEMIAAAIKK